MSRIDSTMKISLLSIPSMSKEKPYSPNYKRWDYVNDTSVDDKDERRDLIAIITGVKFHIYKEIRNMKKKFGIVPEEHQMKSLSKIYGLCEKVVIVKSRLEILIILNTI